MCYTTGFSSQINKFLVFITEGQHSYHYAVKAAGVFPYIMSRCLRAVKIKLHGVGITSTRT